MMISLRNTALERQYYAWSHLLGDRKFISSLRVEMQGDNVVSLLNDKIKVLLAPFTAWKQLIESPPYHIKWLPAKAFFPPNYPLSFTEPLPILFWGKREQEFPAVQRHRDGTITFAVDIVSTVLFMLSRWEEIIITRRDRHGRFPAVASVAYKQGFLDRPIVDEYALVLESWMKTLFPRLDLNKRQRYFTIKISHDIDYARCSTRLSLLRYILKFWFFLQKEEGIPKRSIHALKALLNQNYDPCFLTICQLAQLSEAVGLRSAFYFMASDPSRFDSGYNLSSPALQVCLKLLRRKGHEIGFHAGYYSFNSLHKFSKEKERFQRNTGLARVGGRQHYLRFQVPQTWYIWEQKQMKYDSTLGYADSEGFRAGTCRPFRPYDIKNDRQLNLVEIPLVVMDVTLRTYRGMSPWEAEERILLLAQRCKRVQGTFTLLWHNTSLLWNNHWNKMYQTVLQRLAYLV